MWQFERWTVRRTALSSAILCRVFNPRRVLASFLSCIVHSLSSLSRSIARLFLLGFLQDNLLVGIAHALALVRLRGTVGAHLRRDFSDLLFVDSLDDDLGLRRRLDLDSLRHRMNDRVREAQREI